MRRITKTVVYFLIWKNIELISMQLFLESKIFGYNMIKESNMVLNISQKIYQKVNFCVSFQKTFMDIISRNMLPKIPFQQNLVMNILCKILQLKMHSMID
jgi:hypothetical protein